MCGWSYHKKGERTPRHAADAVKHHNQRKREFTLLNSRCCKTLSYVDSKTAVKLLSVFEGRYAMSSVLCKKLYYFNSLPVAGSM